MAALSLGAFGDLLNDLALAQVFKPSRSLDYGVYYTALLASVYLPTRQTLKDVGEAHAARFVGHPPPRA